MLIGKINKFNNDRNHSNDKINKEKKKVIKENLMKF